VPSREFTTALLAKIFRCFPALLRETICPWPSPVKVYKALEYGVADCGAVDVSSFGGWTGDRRIRDGWLWSERRVSTLLNELDGGSNNFYQCGGNL
jgi:hypothetical protein